MKKLIVLTAVLALFSAPAFAGITGTGHGTAGCVGCHIPHGALPLTGTNGTFLGRDVDAVGAANMNEFCFSCHDSVGVGIFAEGVAPIGSFAATANLAAYDVRSTGAARTDHPVGAALTVDAQPVAGVYCTSCHDPHDSFAGGTGNGLLKAIPANVSANICGTCHTTKI